MKQILPLILIAPLLFAHDPPAKQNTAIIPASSLGASDLQITFSPFAEYPDLCEDKDGNIWVAYTELAADGKELIVAKKIVGFTVTDSLIASAGAGFEYAPRMCLASDGGVWIVWAAKRSGNWDIYARSIQGSKLSDEMRVTSSDDIDIHPAIAPGPKGEVWIVWESQRDGNFDIMASVLRGGSVTPPVNLSSSPFSDMRPSLVVDKSGLPAVAWDRQVLDSYRIMMRGLGGKQWGKEEVVSEEVGFNMSPSLILDSQRNLTVAWHSNVRRDGSVGMTPWVYLKRYGRSGETLLLAEQDDQAKVEEDQGSEFPVLVAGRKNRLWVLSRPSQGFYIQALEGRRKSALYKISLDGWGGRGEQMRGFLGNDGALYSVRRDIRFIYLNRLPVHSATIPLDRETVSIPANVMKRKHAARAVRDSSSRMRAGEYEIIFGDLHQHSALSDGMGTADQCYARSRHVYGHDFATLTDHEWFTGNMILPSEWEWIKIVGRTYDSEPEFITLAAYEWTSARVPAGAGHKNVYFSDWDQPVFGLRNTAPKTPELFRMLKDHRAIAIPHHIGWTGVDWENHNEEVQPVFEIVSAHGAFEYMGNEPIMHRGGIKGHFVQDGLLKGLRFGLIGASDGHGLLWHHGISRIEDEWKTGLAAVLVQTRTREAIMDALKKRRVYATSGQRIRLLFRSESHWMGDTLSTTAPPRFTIDVEGTAALKYVKLIRNGEEVLTLGRDIADGRGVRTTFEDATIQPGNSWYYVRVVQEDGEMAWSSPIWVSYRIP